MLNKIFRYLLLITILAIPFYIARFSIFGIPSTLLEVLIFLTFIFALLSGQLKKIKNPLAIFLGGLFVFAGLVAVYFDPSKTSALGIWKAYFFDGYLVFLLVLSLREENQRTELLNYLVISGVLNAVLALGYYFAGVRSDDNRLLDLARLSPNYISMFLVPIFTLTIALFVKMRQKAKSSWLYFAACAVLLLTVILTDSRGGYVALAAGLIVIVFDLIKKKIGVSWSKTLAVAGLIALIGGSAWFFRPDFSDMGRKATSSNIRYYIWTTSLQIAKKNPVFGVGLSNYQNYFTDFTRGWVNYDAYIAPKALTAHNLYLHVYLTMGILGILSFILLLWGSRFWRAEFVVGAPFITILILGLFDTPFFRNDLSVLFWIILAASFWLKQKSGKDQI
jgi:O-antigen ligase